MEQKLVLSPYSWPNRKKEDPVFTLKKRTQSTNTVRIIINLIEVKGLDGNH